MQLSEFIKKTSEIITLHENSVIIFQGALYPHLFFTQLIDKIKSELSSDLKTIDMQSGDFAYKSQLGTSFLGMNCVYWLADCSALKGKQKDEFIDYLINYEGPHTILVYFDAKITIPAQKKIPVISIKDRYFIDDAKALWVETDIVQAQKIAFFLTQIYKIKNSFSLDELFLLKNYQDLLGSDSQKFYESWIARLVIADTSLFTLSQFFFEKKEQSFFKLWLQIKPLYSDMFWISFWSDQLYRAYFFIRFTQQENYIAAKQVSFGLSFSFLKQTYKQYKLDEFQRAHQAMYALDIALKNSGNSYQIDQFYIDFFSGIFKN